MDLAAHLGGMTVGEMLERMSDDELDGWALYNRKHGLTRHRMELYLAQIAYMQSDGKNKVADFMLKPTPDEEEDSGMTAQAFSAIGGAKVHYITMPKGQ
jgi:hypothetical protein